MNMELEFLKQYVEYQVKHILNFDLCISKEVFANALARTRYSFSHCKGKYIDNLSVYNTTQYCVFLYFLSNEEYKNSGSGMNAEKVYYLNKILHCVDLFYANELPSIWNVEHPLASVMGGASYNDYFFFYQGCTVGGSSGFYPKLGHHVVMFSNSKVLGKAIIGNYVIFSANAYVINEDIPDNSIVFGSSPNLIIKTYSKEFIAEKQSHFWR